MHILEISVEQVGAVHGAALGLGVELGREDGPGLVHHALVASIIEVDEVLLEFGVQGAGINGVTMVLAGDMALASRQVQSGDVVGTVAIFHLDGASARCQGQELVAKANAHDGHRRSLDQARQVVNGVLAVGRVTRAVRDEDAVKVRSDLVDGEIIRQHRHGCSAADKAAQNVLLHAAVDQGNVEGRVGRRHDERSLGAHFLDEVDLGRVHEALVLVGIVFVTNGDPSQRGTLLSEVSDDGTSIDTGDGRDALTRAPVGQAFDGGPVAVLLCDVGHDNSSTLDVGRLEVLQEVELVSNIRRDSIITDQRLGEDQDLATVGGIGH